MYFVSPLSFLSLSLFLLTIITTRQIIHHLKSAIMVSNHSSSAQVSTQRSEAQGSHDSNKFAHQTELSAMKLTIAFKVNTVRGPAQGLLFIFNESFQVIGIPRPFSYANAPEKFPRFYQRNFPDQDLPCYPFFLIVFPLPINSVLLSDISFLFTYRLWIS